MGQRLHSPDVIEGYEDEEIHDRQLRIAGWFVQYEGVDAGTRKKRKRLSRETIDDLKPIFGMLGLGGITDDSGLWDLIESGKYTPNRIGLPELPPVPTPEPVVAEPDSLDEVPEPFKCTKGHSICERCGHCVCRNPNVRVRRVRNDTPLCTPCRGSRRRHKW
jgi:hypothetical protein